MEPIHFLDEPITVHFEMPPAREKLPPCLDGFTWRGRDYRVTEKLSKWSDFTRHGRMARNMRLAHAEAAASCGSLNVGRFYFRARGDTGQVFDIYYDRAGKTWTTARGSG